MIKFLFTDRFLMGAHLLTYEERDDLVSSGHELAGESPANNRSNFRVVQESFLHFTYATSCGYWSQADTQDSQVSENSSSQDRGSGNRHVRELSKGRRLPEVERSFNNLHVSLAGHRLDPGW